MKFTKLVLIPLTVLLLTSCSKDFSEEIIGTWVIESATFADCPDEGIAGGTINADENGCIFLFEETGCQSLTFEENNSGNFTISYNDEEDQIEPFSYLLNEDENIVSICVDGECNPLTYVDDKLEITYEEDGCPITMVFTAQ